MDYKQVLEADIKRGFTKKELEILIGLPENNLAGFLKGNKKFTQKNLARIERWEQSNKPDPLTLEVARKPKSKKKDKSSEFETKDESQSSFKLNLKQILALPKQEQGETKSELDEQIAKLEERLLLPSKYLPKYKRDMVERELVELKRLKIGQ